MYDLIHRAIYLAVVAFVEDDVPVSDLDPQKNGHSLPMTLSHPDSLMLESIVTKPKKVKVWEDILFLLDEQHTPAFDPDFNIVIERWKRLADANMGSGLYRSNDALTEELIQCCLSVLDVTRDEFLERVGDCFLERLLVTREKCLRAMGKTFVDFLENLNQLHSSISSSFPEGNFPTFMVGELNTSEDSFVVKYRSQREGYSYFALGLLKSVGERLFNIKKLSIELKKGPSKLEKGGERCLFFVRCECPTCGTERLSPSPLLAREASDISRANLKKYGMDNEVLLKPWPWHILVDHQLRIIHVGPSLRTRLPKDIDNGTFLWFDHFSLVSPIIPPSKLDFKALSRRTSLLTNITLNHKLHIVGQLAVIAANSSHQGGLIFFGSPRVRSHDEMEELNLYMSDFAPGDASRELLLRGANDHTFASIVKGLDQKTHQMCDLLEQMFPKRIAKQMMNGETVTPEYFESVTLFFSDIVGFTSMCSLLEPIHVVNLLNTLYTVMDYCANKFGVYKIETIGDAWFGTTGLPERADPQEHASRMASFALAVLECAKYIVVPELNEPLVMRIGLHVGSCMAGIVGSRVPRYCLFGDTVNTASRMESTSLPGHIHVSKAAHDILRLEGFELEPRGSIEVKGKGQTETFFLKSGLAPSRGRFEQCIEFAKVVSGQKKICCMNVDEFTKLCNTSICTKYVVKQECNLAFDDDDDISIASFTTSLKNTTCSTIDTTPIIPAYTQLGQQQRVKSPPSPSLLQ